tara:strand:- start:828 stop:1202 length:375 start_codon:yes stop_codon:yes gene_type:complete
MVDAVIELNNAGPTPHAAHVFSEEISIIGFHVTMVDGGDGTQFTFQLAADSASAFAARTMNLVGSAVNATPAAAHAPLSASVSFSPVTVTAGNLFGVVVTSGPTTLNAGGQLMTVTIEARRKIV